MCGIIGYIGNRPATEILLTGLQRLEYRGYDSAGIATVNKGKLHRQRTVGSVTNLVPLIEENPLIGNIGIAHTRWATHGVPSDKNAHPHFSNGPDPPHFDKMHFPYVLLLGPHPDPHPHSLQKIPQL